MTRWWWFRACNSSSRENGEVPSSTQSNGKNHCNESKQRNFCILYEY